MPVHPNSLANLRPRPWPKGVSGNSRGRRQGDISLTHRLERLLKTGITLEEFQQIDEKKLPLADVILKRWLEKSIDPRAGYADNARQQLFDRLLGKASRDEWQVEARRAREAEERRLARQQPDGEESEGQEIAPSWEQVQALQVQLEQVTEEKDRWYRQAIEERAALSESGHFARSETTSTVGLERATVTDSTPGAKAVSTSVQTPEERWAAMTPDERWQAEQAALLKKLQDEKYGERKEVGMYSRKRVVEKSWESWEATFRVPRGSGGEDLRAHGA